MRPLLLGAARALLAVAITALVADGLLGMLTSGVTSLTDGPSSPWWVTGHVVERSRWVVFALLAIGALRAGAMREAAEHIDTTAGVWRLTGTVAIVVPLLWTLANWLVQATLFTAAGRWQIDGQVFTSPDYYRRVLAGYAPWLLGGIAARIVSRHAG